MPRATRSSNVYARAAMPSDTRAPPNFLARLQPATFGQLPRKRIISRWFGVVGATVVCSGSTAGENGVSWHVVADETGRWIAYRHDRRDGKRRLVGMSDWALYLARHFGAL